MVRGAYFALCRRCDELYLTTQWPDDKGRIRHGKIRHGKKCMASVRVPYDPEEAADDWAMFVEGRLAVEDLAEKELLGWEPKVSLEEGLRMTIDWYVKTHRRRGYVDEKLLMERA